MIINLKQWLKGKWRVHRDIQDFRDTRQITRTFDGVIDFHEAEDGTLHAHEEGEVTLGNYHGPATSDLIYYFPSVSVAKVLFQDRRQFHDLDLRLGFWKVEHMCDGDRYTGTFTVMSDRTLKICWTIRGKQKKLEMTSILTREGIRA